MDIEKLYQDVWARVFAQAWMENNRDDVVASSLADEAAADAVRRWDPAAAHEIIAAKAKQS